MTLPNNSISVISMQLAEEAQKLKLEGEWAFTLRSLCLHSEESVNLLYVIMIRFSVHKSSKSFVYPKWCW